MENNSKKSLRSHGKCDYRDLIKPSQASKNFTGEEFVVSFTTNLRKEDTNLGEAKLLINAG
jgi:hypothetical protein